MNVSGARPPNDTLTEGLPSFMPNVYDAIVIGELGALAEVADDGRFGDGLGHLDVEGVLPLRVLDVVASRAGSEPRYSPSLAAGAWGLGAWVPGCLRCPLVRADGQRQQQEQRLRSPARYRGSSRWILSTFARAACFSSFGGLPAWNFPAARRTKIKGP